MKPMLVLRPEPGAAATARRIEGMGGRAIVAPLFRIEPLDWEVPARPFDALMLTSANAVRASRGRLAGWSDLPCYAVGSATADALRSIGLAPAWIGEGDANDLVAALARDGRQSALHLSGEDFRAAESGSVHIAHVPVYRSIAVEALPHAALEVLAGGAVALLHSPRAAALFARLVRHKASVAIAAISPAAADAAGPGWHAVAIAAQPSDQALLAAAAALCEE